MRNVAVINLLLLLFGFVAFSEETELPLPALEFTPGPTTFAPNFSCGVLEGTEGKLYLENRGNHETFKVGAIENLRKFGVSPSRGHEFCVEYKISDGEKKIVNAHVAETYCGKRKSIGKHISLTNSTGDGIFPLGGSPDGDEFLKQMEKLLGMRTSDGIKYCVIGLTEFNDVKRVVGASIYDEHARY